MTKTKVISHFLLNFTPLKQKKNKESQQLEDSSRQEDKKFYDSADKNPDAFKSVEENKKEEKEAPTIEDKLSYDVGERKIFKD